MLEHKIKDKKGGLFLSLGEENTDRDMANYGFTHNQYLSSDIQQYRVYKMNNVHEIIFIGHCIFSNIGLSPKFVKFELTELPLISRILRSYQSVEYTLLL